VESLGEKLKNARNEKRLNLEQISRETNISVQFLEALESENFDIFPGEAYIIGFLKNYSAFLELDTQKVISLYRALRIQEQPVPVEHLIRKPPRLPAFLLPALVIIVILGAGGWGIYSLIIHRQNNPTLAPATIRTSVEHIMEGSSIERRLHINDSVLIPIDSVMHRVELFNLTEIVTIRTENGGLEILDLSQEVTIDLNNDGIPDLRITVMEFERNNPDWGARLQFYLIGTTFMAGTEFEPDIPLATTAATASITTIIPPSPNPHPFTLQINFQGFTMFRWEILHELDRRGTNQRFFQHNETLEIQAQNGIRIWSSNATAARFQLFGGGRTFPVEIGATGEVVVTEVRWIRDEDGRFRVVVIQLES